MNERDSRDLQEELERAEAQLAGLETERDRLIAHISGLQAEIAAAIEKTARNRNPTEQATSVVKPGQFTSAEKMELFRDLFRGRTDVYPKRWVNSRKGTKGYSPACSNEWVRGLCEKPRVKCGECTNRAFIPVSEKTIYDHLRGRQVVGAYPLLENETCWFLAVDFDKAEWHDDVEALVETCKSRRVPCAIERSRSGNGAHVWFFFQSPVPAGSARKMGCYLITETMSRRHKLPMTSYDRFFPNQDTLPRGGFGNLIALPFQDGPRQQGNTVFVDMAWTPYQDQWTFLSSIERIAPSDVNSMAREATVRGQVIGVRMDEPADEEDISTPWARSPSRRQPKPVIGGPLPKRVRSVLAQRLFVEKAGLPSPLINQIKRLAAFQNPEFYKRQAMRLSTALTPRVINCAEDLTLHIGLPRGCVGELKALLADLGVFLEVDDKRTKGENLEVRFQGKLRQIQEQAVKTFLEHDIGVFVAPPGSGKTVVGSNLIALRGCNTLVLVHRTQLLEQWRSQLSVFLDLKSKEIGRIGAGKSRPNGQLDVVMIQSLARRDEVDQIVANYGHVIVDECHHVPAVSFERVMREVKAHYITGLTATPRRRDGHHPILQLQIGPVRFSIDQKSQAAERSFEHRLIVRNTEFKLSDDSPDAGIQEIYRQLASDERRNRMILDDVVQALEERRSPILLTERRDHLEFLAERLRPLTPNLIILQGGMKTRDRRQAIEQLSSVPETKERLVLATGRFIGEGFDDARLDTLFLTMPVSWKGTLVQYSGRLHRQHHAKTEVRIMDYVDRDVPMLARMFQKRMRGYHAMGYEIGKHEMSQFVDTEYVIDYSDEEMSQIPDEDFL